MRRVLLAAPLALALFASPLPAAAQPWVVAPASDGAEIISQLFWFTLVLATIVFVLVEGLLIYSSLRFRRRVALLEQSVELAQPNQVERASESRMLLRFGTNNVHVFKARCAANAKVAQVFAEKSEAFAAEENRVQRKHGDGHDRIASEEELDAALDYSPSSARLIFRDRE